MSKARGRHWFLGGAAIPLAIQACGPVPQGPAPPMPVVAKPPARAGGENCLLGSLAKALANGQSVRYLTIDVFHRPETGWETYAPLVAHEIGTACEAATPAFASHLARWQISHAQVPTGVMDGGTFKALKEVWDARRPFERISMSSCPPPPDLASLATVPPALSYGGKAMQLRPRALAAYEKMASAARSEVPGIRAHLQLMTLFSAFRSPADDEARCAGEGNCQGVTRANCSAHRTGLAVDIDLGAAPGSRVDSADNANRLYISRGIAYRWLVANAPRFDFVNYPYEPWHWEWTGEAP